MNRGGTFLLAHFSVQSDLTCTVESGALVDAYQHHMFAVVQRVPRQLDYAHHLLGCGAGGAISRLLGTQSVIALQVPHQASIDEALTYVRRKCYRAVALELVAGLALLEHRC